MRFLAKQSTVEAYEVAPVVDGQPTEERRFVVDGLGVIDSITFLALYMPAVEKNSEAVRVPRRTAKAKPESAPAPSATTTAENLLAGHEVSGCEMAVLKLLVKGPATAMDLVRSSRYNPGTVYPVLAKLRKSGHIKTMPQEDQSPPLNFLVREKAA